MGQMWVDAVQGEPEQGGGAEKLRGVAEEDDAAAVVAVGGVAGGQHEEEAGEKEGEAGVAEVERGVGDLVDLPGYGDRLCFGSDDDEHAGRFDRGGSRVRGMHCLRWVP